MPYERDVLDEMADARRRSAYAEVDVALGMLVEDRASGFCGDDLRELAIVVEPMHGIDDLSAAVSRFAPAPDRRLGVLVDHLAPGSNESRIAAAVERLIDFVVPFER